MDRLIILAQISVTASPSVNTENINIRRDIVIKGVDKTKQKQKTLLEFIKVCIKNRSLFIKSSKLPTKTSLQTEF